MLPWAVLLLPLFLGGWLPRNAALDGAAAAPSASPANQTVAPATTEVTCEVDADCHRPGIKASVQGVLCDSATRRCICGNRTLVLTKAGRCLPIRMLGQPCRRDEQCHKIDKHADCDDGYCKCEDGYYLFHDINGTSCLQDQELQTIRPFGADRKSESISEENMVPIIVCLAIMFVGMCVALQLFSRARFRNQRTIFNTPNARLTPLKLGSGKRGKRRASHVSLPGGSRRPSACSQLSPSRAGSRAGSIAGSRAGSRAGSQCGSPDLRRSSMLHHHAEREGKDHAPTLVNGPAVESALQNGSPKVIVNRGRSPSPPAHV